MTQVPSIVIVNTGCANLTSVDFAIKRLGFKAIISDEPSVIQAADKVFLPGVGTAQAAMNELKQRQLVEVVKGLTQPVLGICLGMQLLTSFSEETGGVDLLDKIDVKTQLLSPGALPVPHCGWNQVSACQPHPLFDRIASESYFYFVHSYHVPIGGHTLAQSNYGGMFSAAIFQDNFIGVQFHPERSGQVGSQLLQNFITLV